jgi:hypothetical protein
VEELCPRREELAKTDLLLFADDLRPTRRAASKRRVMPSLRPFQLPVLRHTRSELVTVALNTICTHLLGTRTIIPIISSRLPVCSSVLTLSRSANSTSTPSSRAIPATIHVGHHVPHLVVCQNRPCSQPATALQSSCMSRSANISPQDYVNSRR